MWALLKALGGPLQARWRLGGWGLPQVAACRCNGRDCWLFLSTAQWQRETTCLVQICSTRLTGHLYSLSRLVFQAVSVGQAPLQTTHDATIAAFTHRPPSRNWAAERGKLNARLPKHRTLPIQNIVDQLGAFKPLEIKSPCRKSKTKEGLDYVLLWSGTFNDSHSCIS